MALSQWPCSTLSHCHPAWWWQCQRKDGIQSKRHRFGTEHSRTVSQLSFVFPVMLPPLVKTGEASLSLLGPRSQKPLPTPCCCHLSCNRIALWFIVTFLSPIS